MHRHLEFRIWDKKNKGWLENVFPYLIVGKNIKTGEPSFIAVTSTPDWDVVRCTGIKGSNDQMIWEGDVVRLMCFSKDCDPIHFGIVEYDISNGGFSIVDHEHENNVPLIHYHKDRMVGIDRLGNTYENPELAMTLEQKVAKE